MGDVRLDCERRIDWLVFLGRVSVRQTSEPGTFSNSRHCSFAAVLDFGGRSKEISMTTFRSIEAAIHDLSEAERLAQAFGWPQETIDRINLLKRGTINIRTKMVRENNERALERLDMRREADANSYAIEG
jgi:hypothetical protein